MLDSGTGFPDHILKRAFEPYVTTKAKGTGLGLPVSSRILEEHGGWIEAANWRAGEASGAVFSIYLPKPPDKLTLDYQVKANWPAEALETGELEEAAK